MTPDGPISLRAYAERRNVSAMAVSKAIKAGRLVRSVVRDERGQPKIADPDLADQEWDASTRKEKRPNSGPGGSGESLGDARARLDAAKADLAELELAERRAELVPARDVAAKLTTVFASCRTKLLGIPSRARQLDPTLTPAQLAMLEDLLREALEGLATEGADEEAA